MGSIIENVKKMVNLKSIVGVGAVAAGLGLMVLAITMVLTPIIASGAVFGASAAAAPPSGGTSVAVGTIAGLGVGMTSGTFGLAWATVFFMTGLFLIGAGLGLLGINMPRPSLKKIVTGDA